MYKIYQLAQVLVHEIFFRYALYFASPDGAYPLSINGQKP
jgi:hypothetical protein